MRADTSNVWLVWNQTATTAATTNYLAAQTAGSLAITGEWYDWVHAQEETADMRRARQQAQAAQDQRNRDLAAARRAASERAERLLDACLTSAQRDSLRREGWFAVHTRSGRVYKIRRGRVRNVVEMKTQRTYCCHPAAGVPDADSMLAQKLMLETQEEEFLRLANVS